MERTDGMKPSARLRRLHFVGLGGAGMSALAEALAGFGFSVRGSDRSDSPALRRLRGLGMPVFIGHDASQVDPGCDAVVYSAAVDPGNPELRAARELGVPRVRRAELLGILMGRKHGLAVAGAHGKTTTTGMLIHILRAAGGDPSWVAGGVWAGGEPGRAGGGDFLVAEADEYDRAFLSLKPVSAVATNIDSDHLDTYGTQEALDEAFVAFLNALPFHGTAVIHAEDPGLARVLGRIRSRVKTYGLGSGDYQARRLESDASGSRFSVWNDGADLGKVRLRTPGLHNACNALGAAALALEEGVSFGAVAQGLEAFPGMRRRMERVGARRGITVFDDYAHHPTEVAAALQALRLMAGKGRLCAVFQPHLYSRTRQLTAEFARAFLACDLLFVLPVYAAREEPIPGVEGNVLTEAASGLGHAAAHFLAQRSAVAREVARALRAGDVCATLGAGDVGDLAPQILEALG
jgi:UDP-N-acetylmuramate--alanine ligase